MDKVDKLVKFASILEKISAHPRADYMREYMRNRYKAKRKWLINELGGKCVNCGTEKGPFHVDHKDKKKKTFRAADVHSVSDKKIKAEMPNLQILCVVCHKKKTHEAWDYSAPKPSHGTVWMYSKHKCRCDLCTDAYKKYIEKRKNNKGA